MDPFTKAMLIFACVVYPIAIGFAIWVYLVVKDLEDEP